MCCIADDDDLVDAAGHAAAAASTSTGALSAFTNFVLQQLRPHPALDAALPGGPMRVTRVVPVQHALVGTFLQLHAADGTSRGSNPVLRPPNPTDADSVAALAKLKSCFADAPGGFSRVVFAWHATRADLLHTVCRDGPRSLRLTDAGFFGAGSYFALEAAYAARYAKFGPPNAAGEFGVILYAVSVSRAVPLTLGEHYRTPAEELNPAASTAAVVPRRLHGFSRYYSGDAKVAPALSPNCDAHFVPVRHCGRTHPVDGATPLPHDVDYQACPAGRQAEGHELVLLSHLRCTPVAIVYFR